MPFLEFLVFRVTFAGFVSAKEPGIWLYIRENSIATAGVLGGVTGLLLGGFWIGAAGFVATSYLAKKDWPTAQEDSDVATVLKGVSSASLEALNFVDYLNSKYDVTSKVGTALNDALEKGDSETTSSVKGSLDTVGEAIDSFDKDVGIKDVGFGRFNEGLFRSLQGTEHARVSEDTLGSLILSGTDLASQLATKVVELNDQYKVTDQIKSKIDECSFAMSSMPPFEAGAPPSAETRGNRRLPMATGCARQPGDLVEALEKAAAKVSEIIARAEWLLDPTSPEAKSAAEGARSFVKLFFDEGQVRSPEALRSNAKDLPRLLVDGFDREQIWEEMEVQNVPLRLHLRKRVSKLAVASKGAIDLTLATGEQVPEAPTATEPGPEEDREELPKKKVRAKESSKKGRREAEEPEEAVAEEVPEGQEAAKAADGNEDL
eukprot:s2102_g4.t1